MQQKYNAEELLKKYRLGQCTPEERVIIESWHLKQLKEFDIKTSTAEMIEAKGRMWANIVERTIPVRRINNRKWMYYAASILLIAVSTIIYYDKGHPLADRFLTEAPVKHIVPGSNKAILTLADGSTVNLDQSTNGVIAKQGNTLVNKTANGRLQYQSIGRIPNAADNTVTVPRGGTYHLTLSDGTKVWLNSASSMRFPVSFSEKERSVKLSGEVYFEVAKDKKRPFNVDFNGQTITVLGTHFNVHAYNDERTTVTTLLEGTIRISKGKFSNLLRPGQQAINVSGADEIKVADVLEADEAIDWKNGYFSSSKESIYSVMKKISRWYDVDVQYRGNFEGKNFGGSISRFAKVTEVLKIIELAGAVHFKIEGRVIIVMP